MVDKQIKNKIENKTEISSEELIKFFSAFPAPIEKGLFKKFRQKRKEQTHEDTKQYLLDNFETILSSVSVNQLIEFFESFSNFSHKKEIFEKLSTNNSRLIELFNMQGGYDLHYIFNSILSREHDAYAFFEHNFKEFYANTTSQQFNIQNFLITLPVSEKIPTLIIDGLLDSMKSKMLRPEDIPLFLEKYLYRETSEDQIFWNEIQRPISKIPEKTTSKIQEDISPELALYLLQSTYKPLYIHNFLQSIGINTPELTSYLDSNLDTIVQEISDYSSDPLAVKIIIQELLSHEAKKPSDIEYSAKGGFGKVFKIGDKVLKYGRTPHNPELPYNSELFLQPLFRHSINRSDFLEIYEQVDVGCTREEMYQLYKALREQGLIWTDIKSSNVGRLRKQNTIHFEGIDSVSHRAVGFKEDKKIPIAQPGEIVLIDLDYVFLEGTETEVPLERRAMDNFYEFSARYKREKESEKNLEKSSKTPTQDPQKPTPFDEI